MAVLALDRPPANAYDHALLRELGSAIDHLRVEPGVDAVVLESSNPRFFSAGADLEAFAAQSPRLRAMTCLLAHEVFRKIELSPQPFVAAITGHALGGGLELALACDLRILSEGSHRLGLPEVGVGLLPGSGATQRLPRLVGLPQAIDLIVTGRLLSPFDAAALGIVDRLVADANACRQSALETAQKWTGHQGGGSDANMASASASAPGLSSSTSPARASRRKLKPPR